MILTLEGDKIKAEALRGIAMSQLNILHNAMAFQDLKQDVKRVTFADGSLIEVSSNWGLDSVKIFVPPVLPVPAEAEEAKALEIVWTESWGETLCENHQWYSNDTCCPTLPVHYTYPGGEEGSASLLEGVLHMEGRSQLFWGIPWDATYPDCSSSPIFSASVLMIKVSGSAIPPIPTPEQPAATGSLVIVHDTSGHLVPFTFYFVRSKVFSPAPNYQWIGDNNGEWQSIDLAMYGIAGSIHKMALRTYIPQATGYDCQMRVDHIVFRRLVRR